MSKGSAHRKGEDTKRIVKNLGEMTFKPRCEKCHKRLDDCKCKEDEKK